MHFEIVAKQFPHLMISEEMKLGTNSLLTAKLIPDGMQFL